MPSTPSVKRLIDRIRRLPRFARAISHRGGPNVGQLISGNGPDHQYAIECFSLSGRCIRVAGWMSFSNRAIRSLELEVAGFGRWPMKAPGLPSPDVAAHLGPAASACRFDEQIVVEHDFTHGTGHLRDAMLAASLIVSFDGGETRSIGGLQTPLPGETTSAVFDQFLSLLTSLEHGKVLEIGSRARSGNVHRSFVPQQLAYTGLDIIEGPNVDIVGDAHALSDLFPAGHFNGVFAISVVEHILMPWKLAIEMNRIMAPGGVGYLATHQGWPIHDAPWDFWRFSDKAWTGLFNKATGFEIVAAAMGEPASVVARRWHPTVDFGSQPVYLSSAVLFRKVSETQLDWPVELAEITQSMYPGDQI